MIFVAVYRVNKNRGYTVMANFHLRDKSLSLKAVGLLSKMLSFNDGWKFSTKGLSAICKEVEAESVAYTVCQRYGIETSDYSFGYIAGWSSGKETKELKARPR